jgi:crotonobetainyl-CoA:carnitine CoA-transferase CaiB-like acyl-CoA transferase
MAGPLSGIRVLDLSRILAAPYTGQMLADLGADVVKVERPGAGDDTRSWGPPYLKDTQGNETREAGYYLAINRGKRSVTVDISTGEGQDIVRKLAVRSDIVLENYKTGTLARYGLGYDDLCKIKPSLIYCSVTGFGQTGPRSEQAAYDFMIQAMGGLMSVTGESDDKPGGGPQKVGFPVVDVLTGCYAAIAVLAALHRRERTGKGDYIDIAMFDTLAGSLINQSMNYLISGKTPCRSGNRHPNIQPQDVVPCRDGYIALAVGNDGQFAALCKVIGKESWAQDARYARNRARVDNRDDLLKALTDVFKTEGRAHWVAKLDDAGVPCGPINTVADLLADPQIAARQMLLDLPHPQSGKVPLVASPMKFRDAQISYERAPPLLGQHAGEILAELGYTADEIEDLRARNIT